VPHLVNSRFLKRGERRRPVGAGIAAALALASLAVGASTLTQICGVRSA
jgi:hypothetical protein